MCFVLIRVVSEDTAPFGKNLIEFLQDLSPQEIAVVQSRFAVEVLQAWMNAGTRMMQISLRASDTLRSAAQRADEEGKNAVSAGS